MKLFKTLAVSLVCMILGVFIAWQYQSIRNNASIISLENKRRSEIQEELFSEKKRNDVLEAELLRLQELNKALEADIGGNNENFRRLAEEKDKYKMIAGLTTVRGDGVVITLKDTDSYVYYTDILLLLNELKAADVQAISINDERVVTTTEIRSAGRYIMVNGRQFVSPYTIKAIADPEKLDHSLKLMGGVIERIIEESYLFVEIKRQEGIIIPKVRDDGTVLRYDRLQNIE